MIDSRNEMFLWVEKYRPQKIDECVLPESLKKTFKEYIAQGELPNFLFMSPSFMGASELAAKILRDF